MEFATDVVRPARRAPRDPAQMSTTSLLPDAGAGASVYGPVKPVTTRRMPFTVRFTSIGERSGGNFVTPETYRSSFTVTAR
jgi:hypothetical protein